MTFGAVPFAESSFAGVSIGAPASGGGGEPPVILVDPFTVEIGGVSYAFQINTLSIDTDANRQGTANFVLCNIETTILIGQPVRILFYDDVIFSGSLDRIKYEFNADKSYKTYTCECLDHSYLLIRTKIKQSYTNSNLSIIANALIVNYLGGDGVTMGTLDNGLPLPLVDANNVSIYDALSDAAAALGLTFYIDHDKVLQFRGSTVESAPMPIDDTIIEDCDILYDREGYRNYQVVIVTGTPQVEGQTALTVSYTATNGDQIGGQAFIENNNGIYREIETVTHPTSNSEGDLLKLAVSTARILLAINGELRQTVSIKTRQYGFQVGQTATVSIPEVGGASEWIIQRVTMRDEDGLSLISQIDLARSSVQRRKDQVWIDIVKKGQITVIPPVAALNNLQSYLMPGTYQFTVPAGIFIVQATCKAGGGGAGGPTRSAYSGKPMKYSLGGAGGRGGMVVSAISVVPGQVLTITVPLGGDGGNAQATINQTSDAVGQNGGTGGSATVAIGAQVYASAYGGIGGTGSHANAYTGFSGIWNPSPDGAGSGNVVTVGGGAQGGVTGLANPLQNSNPGLNGSVMVEW